MYVGVAKITLAIGEAHSLKDKRMVLRRIKDRVRERLHITLSEVGELDVWQRAELGGAVPSGERAKALELIDDVVRIAMSAGTGAGDKAAGADDFVPEEWKQP